MNCLRSSWGIVARTHDSQMRGRFAAGRYFSTATS